LRSETAPALDVLYQQCEAGKDMMRLMSDLILYLRDLLVFKAKPDAIIEDVDPELQKALAAQSTLVENDRLLDLIDQFAQAEGRMKWAPNKKLHFEVAIIKAIQSLNQATLDEVIEKLGALRDGKASSAKPAPAEKKTLDVEPVAAGVSSPTVEKHADTAAATIDASNGESDSGKIWETVYARIPATKAFVRNSAAAAHVLPSEGRHFVLGFSPDQKSPMDILGTATNRKLIETLLREVSGKDWTLKLTTREDLPAKETSASTARQDYGDDPLIREAMAIFKGEVRR
jgi:DNA polymerase III gamma/tau subunit